MTQPGRVFRRRWAAYLDTTSPVDAYSIAGKTIAFQSADQQLRQFFRGQWHRFMIPVSRVSALDVVFRIAPASATDAVRLKAWHGFASDRFVFLSDRKRYLLTGYMHQPPWQIDCVPLSRWNPQFVYYHVIEPLMLDLLKRLDVLVWHGAAVMKGGHAVLLSGVSGSGKSTTTLNLLRLGYQFVADDVVLLRSGSGGVQVTGWEREVFLTDRSLALLPEWQRYRSGGRLKRGRQWKHRIDLACFTAPSAAAATVKTLLFPEVTPHHRTSLERLTKSAALVQCLQQPPKEFPATILPAAVDRQFDIYARLVRSASAYRLQLGAEQDGIRTALARLG
jgi:hypothetical protein